MKLEKNVDKMNGTKSSMTDMKKKDPIEERNIPNGNILS